MKTGQHRSLVVIGADPLAEELGERLQHAGRTVLRLKGMDGLVRLPRNSLRRAEALLLPDSAETSGWVEQLAALRHQDPLRLIRVRERGAPAPLPAQSTTNRLRVETYCIEEAAARVLLTRWPLHAGLDPAIGQIPHLLIAGTAPPASALTLQALRLMHYGTGMPTLTLASDAPDRQRDAFLAAYPGAEAIAHLRFVDLESPIAVGIPTVTTVFVCLADTDAALTVAENLARLIATRQRVSPAIYLEIGAPEPGGDLDDWDGQLYPFSYRHEACRPEILLDGHGDALARTIHAHYRDSIAAQGRDPDLAAAGRSWDALDESYRRASRHQADHLWAKLALTDCRALPEEQVGAFTFAPLEVERLAEIEHDRWAADRLLDGWTYGPERDNARRLHPQLVPYAALSEPMKDLDRFAVRLAPVLLARFGRGLVRMLIVAVAEANIEAPWNRRHRKLLDQILARLRARYPDRSLAIATSLVGVASRTFARYALDHHDAGLILLSTGPLAETLAAQSDAAARHDLLGLVARAERRIGLANDDALQTWYAERAEILVRVGPVAAPAQGKCVHIDLAAEQVTWGFEY